MKSLLILRHAKSSWKDDSLPDHERPLNKRGRQDALLAGRLMREEGLLPDLILSSTAKRARSTVDLVVEESGYGGSIEYSRELYAAGPEAYIVSLAKLPEKYDLVMVVGHNPGLEQLLEDLTDECETLPTAALAQVTIPIESWSELSNESGGKLVNIWRPREMGNISSGAFKV
jgi:phosphohistidine phosphatase